MRKKLYTAFLSSNYSGLKNERLIAIKKLLDANVFPVTMEHFVIGSTDGFKDICELIDDSDIFILLMGTRYGSRDERGDNKSWTEKEFDYARANGKKMLIVRFAPLDALAKSYRDDMTDEEVIALCPDQNADDTRAQLSFARSIDREMVTSVASETEFSDVIGRFLNTIRRDPNVAGWIRDVSLSEIERVLPLGAYYHCHLCDTQPGYLRVGELSITGGDGGYNLHFEGRNYKGKVDGGKISVNETKYTVWNGDYVLDPTEKNASRHLFRAQNRRGQQGRARDKTGHARRNPPLRDYGRRGRRVLYARHFAGRSDRGPRRQGMQYQRVQNARGSRQIRSQIL